MSDDETPRQKVEKFRGLAASATDPETRRMFEELAGAWAEVAGGEEPPPPSGPEQKERP